MGNSQDKPPLRKALSVPDTHSLPPDTQVLYKEKSRSSQRLYQPNKGGNGKQSKSKIKKSKQQKEPQPEFQLPPSEAAFLPAFPLRGDLEDVDFEVIEVIAKGAYGNVIKVQREDDKRFYATKILSKAQILQEGAVRQCKDEASIQSMAGQHPFVVKAYEYWQSRTNLYLVLEYVPHGDMFTLWTFHGAFPEDLVRLYIAEMSLVLDYLHCECVIYRDIKMENILFDAMGHIQLTDFGLAKWLQSGDNTRTVCGTLQYMAPEVLSVYPYGHPADWWSIGILMYTMLAGRYPVDGMDTHTRMAQKVFECDYLLPSNISDSAQDVINRVLTKSPHKRLCNLYHLQDLHFFQDLIFSDLTDGKINPVGVVPGDFFPMTGASWAPYVFEEEDNKQFENFDDTNADYNYNEDYNTNGYKPDQHPSHHDASPMYNDRQKQAQPDRQSNGYNRPFRSEETTDGPYSEKNPNSYDRSPEPFEARASSHLDSQINSYDRSPQRFEARASSHLDSQMNSYDRSTQPLEARASSHLDSQMNGYDRSSEEATTRSFPQPAPRPTTSTYNGKEHAMGTNREFSNNTREPTYPVQNYDGEPKRRDRFDSTSSYSDSRGLAQIPSSSPINYNHSLPSSESDQPPGLPTYPYSSSGQRRGSRESYLAATSREPSLHSSSPAHTSPQPPSLPQNPPPRTLSSQQPFSSPLHSTTHDTNVFKLMEPAPTVTLSLKSTNTNNRLSNNATHDAYNSQMGPRVLPPSSASIVTSPTTKFPSSNRMSGYGQLEEAKIELPLSPVVKSPGPLILSQPNQFIPPKFNQQGIASSALNRFQPPQPPPQSAKPKLAAPLNQFHLQPPPSKPITTSPTQVIPLQPPPQASKPTVHPKPSVAPKPSVPPKSNSAPKPNVLAPVPAVRKSFNTKKSNKSQQKIEQSFDVGQKPQPLHTDKNFNNVDPSGVNMNHHYHSSVFNANLDSGQGSYEPQAAPRPVPRPRPRQAAPNTQEISAAHPHQMTNPGRGDNESSSDVQEPQSPNSYQWNLPTSAVPYFV